MSTSPLYTTIDLGAPGKQLGHIGVPYSHNLGGWANLLMPIACVANGDGPTALVLAGNHGDEYPGPIAILKLMRSLRPEQVRGRLILIPALNLFAAKAATRLSPRDGKNLNRCFPGRPDGTLTEQVAHYLTTVLFPLADVVIDVHTGGTRISPSSTPTSPAPACCPSRPRSRARWSSPPRWAAARM
jgi:predicted deacylase